MAIENVPAETGDDCFGDGNQTVSKNLLGLAVRRFIHTNPSRRFLFRKQAQQCQCRAARRREGRVYDTRIADAEMHILCGHEYPRRQIRYEVEP